MSIKKSTSNTFEAIKHIDEDQEYWFARQLARVLDYSDYRNFLTVISKAKNACKNSGQEPLDHFVDVTNMVQIGSEAERKLDDIKLSRYACYLIVQNGDPRKEIIARAQTYFAIQTRRQELEQESNFKSLDEDQKRLLLRNELKEHNKNLASAAKDAGMLGAKDIHGKKKLKKSQQILDHMGSTELAANLFRATQAEEKLRRENIQGKTKANQTHYEVGKKVRETIKELGGTMPEELPVPEKSIKQVERAKKRIKGD